MYKRSNRGNLHLPTEQKIAFSTYATAKRDRFHFAIFNRANRFAIRLKAQSRSTKQKLRGSIDRDRCFGRLTTKASKRQTHRVHSHQKTIKGRQSN